MKNENPLTFWESIANDIEKTFQSGHPSQWTQKKFDDFEDKMREKILRIVEADPVKKQRCFPGYRSNSKLKTPSAISFYRFFKLQNSTGRPAVREQFAVLLGFDSYVDYCRKKDIPIEVEAGKDPETDPIPTDLSQRINRLNERRLGQIRSFYRSYPLEKIYLHPALADHFRGRVAPALEALMRQDSKVVVHSDSFTGKTTLLHYFSLEKGSPFTRLYLPLSGYQGDLAALAAWYYNLDKTEAGALVHLNDQTVLLLDAFDEIASDALRSELLKELDHTLRYVLTSRSKFIAGKNTGATLILELLPYSTESVYLLVDRLLNNTGQLLTFYNAFRNNSRFESRNELLRYPWLVIFLIERFTDGQSLDEDFFTQLPAEIFYSLKTRMLEKRYQEQSLEEMCRNLGKLVFDKLFSTREEVRYLLDGELDEDQMRFLDELAHFGAANVFSLAAGARNYQFTIPFASQVFAAWYIFSLSTEELKNCLNQIFYIPVFKQVIALALLLRYHKGKDNRVFWETRESLPAGIQCLTPYEDLVRLYLLSYLPKGAIKKGKPPRRPGLLPIVGKDPESTPVIPYEFLTRYLDQVRSILQYNPALERVDDLLSGWSPEKSLENDLKSALEEVLVSFIPLVIQKDPELAEEFCGFFENLPLNDSDPAYERHFYLIREQCVRTQAFQRKMLEAMTQNEGVKFHHYINALLSSPYQHPELNKILFARLKDFHNRIVAEMDGHTRRLMWDDYLDEFSILMLMLKKGNLAEEEYAFLLHLLNSLGILEEDDQYFRSHIGNFQSLQLTEQIAGFMLETLDNAATPGSFSTLLYLLSPYTFLHEKSTKLVETLNAILRLFIDQCDRAFQKGEDPAPAVETSIQAFFSHFIRFQRFGPILEQAEQLLKVWAKGFHQRPSAAKAAKGALTAFLIHNESTALIEALENYPSWSNRVIVYLAQSLETAPPWNHIRPAPAYLQELHIALLRSCSYEGDRQTVEKIIQMLTGFQTSGHAEKSAGVSSFHDHIRTFETEGDFYALAKACRFDEFEDYVRGKGSPRLFPYAFQHALFHIKPLFIRETGGANLEYFYAL